MTEWSADATAYFESHAISGQVATSAGVTEADGILDYPYEGFLRQRTLSNGKTYQPSGTKLSLWWPEGHVSNHILVTEGESDALAALSALPHLPPQAHLPALSVAALPGASFNASQELADASEVYLALDPDEAGQRGLERLSEGLNALGVRTYKLVMPDGRDLSDVLAASEDSGNALATLLVDAELTTPRLPFRTIGELLKDTPKEPEWLWEGFLAPGAITLLAGKPKVGKSTVVASLLDNLLQGTPFLGQRCLLDGRMLLLSEEREGSLGEKARAYGLEDPRLLCDMRHRLNGQPWWATVEKIRNSTSQMDLRLVVVDTFDEWVGTTGEDENSTGKRLEALRPLQDLAGDGVAVLVIAHHRKTPGDWGDAVRGANAFVGAVDIVLELKRKQGNERQLLTMSRYTSTPQHLKIELGDDGYEQVQGMW